MTMSNTDIDTVLAERLDAWCAELTRKLQEKWEHARESNEHFGWEKLRKYVRVYDVRGGKKSSVHAFVDITTGNVYKPGGWSKPAPIVRFNILDDESFEKVLAGDPYGGYLYIR